MSLNVSTCPPSAPQAASSAPISVTMLIMAHIHQTPSLSNLHIGTVCLIVLYLTLVLQFLNWYTSTILTYSSRKVGKCLWALSTQKRHLSPIIMWIYFLYYWFQNWRTLIYCTSCLPDPLNLDWIHNNSVGSKKQSVLCVTVLNKKCWRRHIRYM